MPTVSKQLQTAREDQNRSIEDLAEITKLKPQYIRALEEGNLDVFSAPLYIRGSVRTLAKELKLDEAQVIEDLESELAQTRKFREPPPLNGQRNGWLDFVLFHLSHIPWRYVLPFLAVIGLIIFGALAYRAWQGEQASDPLQNLGPGIYTEPSSNRGDTVNLPDPGQD